MLTINLTLIAINIWNLKFTCFTLIKLFYTDMKISLLYLNSITYRALKDHTEVIKPVVRWSLKLLEIYQTENSMPLVWSEPLSAQIHCRLTPQSSQHFSNLIIICTVAISFIINYYTEIFKAITRVLQIETHNKNS